MKRTLVSLISEQTIPNILAIHHFRPDDLLFVSTGRMEQEGRTEGILSALRMLDRSYEDSFQTIEVVEDSFVDCKEKLGGWASAHEDSEFIVNLTCGTKIMALAAFEYFRELGSLMVYIPLPKNELTTLFPRKISNRPVPLALRLSVTQYLAAYGLTVRQPDKFLRNQQEASGRAELSRWIVAHYGKVKNLLSWLASDQGGDLRRHRDDKKSFNLKGLFSGAADEERQLLRMLGFSCADQEVTATLSRSDIRYLTGGWLEEYCFNEVSAFVGKGIDNTVTGIEVANKLGRNNEFDVMFTKDNALYTIECKSLDQKENRNADILYKIGALQKDFGLRVASFLVSTAESIVKDGKVKPDVQDRADQFRTKVIPPADVVSLRAKLAEILKITTGVFNA